MTIAPPPPVRDAGATRAAASVDRTIQLISAGTTSGAACSPELAKGPWEFDAGRGRCDGHGFVLCSAVVAGRSDAAGPAPVSKR